MPWPAGDARVPRGVLQPAEPHELPRPERQSQQQRVRDHHVELRPAHHSVRGARELLNEALGFARGRSLRSRGREGRPSASPRVGARCARVGNDAALSALRPNGRHSPEGCLFPHAPKGRLSGPKPQAPSLRSQASRPPASLRRRRGSRRRRGPRRRRRRPTVLRARHAGRRRPGPSARTGASRRRCGCAPARSCRTFAARVGQVDAAHQQIAASHTRIRRGRERRGEALPGLLREDRDLAAAALIGVALQPASGHARRAFQGVHGAPLHAFDPDCFQLSCHQVPAYRRSPAQEARAARWPRSRGGATAERRSADRRSACPLRGSPAAPWPPGRACHRRSAGRPKRRSAPP